jgi:hypothetical protein
VNGASLVLETDAEGRRWLRLAGEWRLMALSPRYAALDAELSAHARDAGLGWDLRGIVSLDSVGAMPRATIWSRCSPGSMPPAS